MQQVNYEYKEMYLDGIEIQNNLPIGSIIVNDDNLIQLAKKEENEIKQIIIELTLEEICNGKTIRFDPENGKIIEEQNENGEILFIEKGSFDGEIIKVTKFINSYYFTIKIKPTKQFVIENEKIYTSVFTVEDGNYSIPLPNGTIKNVILPNMNQNSLVVLKGNGLFNKKLNCNGDLYVTFLKYKNMQIFRSLEEYNHNFVFRTSNDQKERSPTLFLSAQKHQNLNCQPLLITRMIEDDNLFLLPSKKVVLIPTYPTLPYFVCFMENGNKLPNKLQGDVVVKILP